MAAVHFTTIPFEPNTANYTYKSDILGGGRGEIRPCKSNIAYPRFEVYKTFLCVFMSNFMVFIALRTVGKCPSRYLFRYGGL